MTVFRRAWPAVRRTAIAVAVLLICGTVALLPAAGTFLAKEDPPAAVDAIFSLEGARAERWMEAADLYRAGYARTIVLSPGRIEAAERILLERGIRYPTNAALARDALQQMGIPSSAIILPEGSVDNTAEEAQMLRGLARARGWRRVMVVTSKYHCRRAGFAFRRELRDSGIQVLVRASRYDTSDPAHWWRARPDIRYVVSELQKLLVYRLGVGG